MAITKRAAHVATTRRTYKGRVYESHLLRRTYREDGKVKHETLANLSHLPSETIELVRASLRGEEFVPADGALEVVRSMPHGHVAAVVGTMRKLGLDSVIASRPSRERSLVMALVAARILSPRSKLATARGLATETKTSTLGEVLDVESASEDELYSAMDWLLERQGAIEANLAKTHLSEGSLVLYDVSGSYYTGRKCDLAKIGHPRDGRKNTPQINYGLLCSPAGCPIAIEVFAGNTGDPATLKAQIEKVRTSFSLKRVVFVSDRGLITQARIREELAPVEGLDWITALRAPAIQSLAERGVVSRSLFDERDLAEVTSPDFPGERLVACRNPLLADERSRKRTELLAATEAELEKVAKATRREKRALRGAGKIGVRVGRVLGRFKMGKHFVVDIGESSFSYARDEHKIAEEAALDGIYVIRTSLKPDAMGAEEAVQAYKGLSQVERAFRSMKTVDLRIRPIHHRVSERVRAHILLCMLAYHVEWHMRRALAPILFDDHEKQVAAAARKSIVAPAQRSPAAKKKAATKRSEDGLPTHSFQTLLADLRTLTKNRIRSSTKKDQAFEFDRIALPTSVQRRAFDLLGVAPL